MSWADGGNTPFHGEKGTTWEGGMRAAYDDLQILRLNRVKIWSYSIAEENIS